MFVKSLIVAIICLNAMAQATPPAHYSEITRPNPPRCDMMDWDVKITKFLEEHSVVSWVTDIVQTEAHVEAVKRLVFDVRPGHLAPLLAREWRGRECIPNINSVNGTTSVELYEDNIGLILYLYNRDYNREKIAYEPIIDNCGHRREWHPTFTLMSDPPQHPPPYMECIGPTLTPVIRVKV